MKLVGIISTAVLSLTLGVAAPAFAQEQHDPQEQAKPEENEKKTQPAKPATQEEKNAKPEQKPETQPEKTAKPEEKQAQQQEKSAKPEEKNTQEHAQATPAPKAQPGRIPDDRFKANFGQQHTFRVTQTDYTRDRRFQYGGYWFGFVGAWPSNWLYTQNVYVIEIDGVYYLCNANYPGVNIALSVTL